MPYIPGLDGLRAIAVIAVLLYHARDISGLPGLLRPSSGFLGVEVFFVISGYLITALLLGEHARTGSVRLGGFWIRRARRLLPALYLLLVGLIAVVAVSGEGVRSIRDELLGAVFYASNWLLIVQDSSYFETIGRPSLLQHLWSLAVEEQFYLLWPLIVFVGLRWFGHRTLFTLTVGAATAATVVAWILFDQLPQYGDVTAIYYRTDIRAGGLLIGAAFAFLWRPWVASEWSEPGAQPLRLGLDIVGAAALVAVVIAQYTFTDQVVDWAANRKLYHAGFLFTSVPTILLILAVVTPGSRIGQALGNRVLRWIGTRSYALYLWHWPVYQLTRPRVDVALDGWASLLIRLAITVALAELSYRLVEQPIRQRRLGLAFRRFAPAPPRPRVFAFAANATAVAAVAAIALALPVVTRGDSGAGPLARAASSEGATRAIATAPLRTVANEQSLADLSLSGAPLSDAPLPGAPLAGIPATPLAGVGDRVPASAWTPPSAAGSLPSATVRATPVTEVAPSNEAAPSPTVVVEPPSDTSTTSAVSGLVSPGTPASGPAGTDAPPASSDEPHPVRTPSSAIATMTVVGDSVVLGASTELVKIGEGVSVYGQVGRQWWQITAELLDLAENGLLADVVVIQLGNNGTLTPEIFDEVMAMLVDARVVLFVNVRVPKSWEGDVNATIAAGVARHAPRARLADWYGASNEHPEFFLPDGVHLLGPGSEALRALIESAVAD